MTTVNLFHTNDGTNQAFPAVGGERGPHANSSLMQIVVLNSYLFSDMSLLISRGSHSLTYLLFGVIVVGAGCNKQPAS